MVNEQIKLLEQHRWFIWAPLALAILIVYFHRTATGVVLDNIAQEFNINQASELGLLSSIYFYTYAVLQVPAGILADFYGPRRTIAISLAIAACGAFAFGGATSLSWLYAARFMVGLGVAFIYINVIKLYAEWFRGREFGTMCGLASLVGNVGMILAAAPFAILIDSTGWHVAFYIVGAATLVVSGYCWCIVRNAPGELGLITISEVESAEGAVRKPQLAQAGVVESIRTVWLNKYTWPPFLASVGIYGVYMTFTGVWGVPYLMQNYEVTRVEAAGYVAALSVGYMIAGPLGGCASDRLKYRRLPYVLYTICALSAWLTLTLWNGGKPPQQFLYPLFVMIGAGSAGVALAIACAKEVNPSNMTGIAAGTANVGAFIGAALLQPIFGYVLDCHWQGTFNQGIKVYPLEAFQAAFWLCAAVLAVSLVFTLMIKETHCGNVSVNNYSKNNLKV